MSEISNRLRREFAAGDMARDAGLTTPGDIVRYDDLRYGTDDDYNILDIYRPKGEENTLLPVIMIIHGGAWVYGDKEVYQYYAMSLAQRGFAVVNFSYRLAPENRFPAQLEDICAVLRWMENNHEKYRLDLGSIFAVGDSAGAHLLGLYAAMCSNPAYLKALTAKYPGADFSLPHQGSILKAIALNCGKYVVSRNVEDDEDAPALMRDLLENGGDDEELTLVDVTGWVTQDYPPVYMMTCPGDFLKRQAPLMIDALMDRNVPFNFRLYGDSYNPLHHVFHCNIRLKIAQICNDEECSFFRSHI